MASRPLRWTWSACGRKPPSDPGRRQRPGVYTELLAPKPPEEDASPLPAGHTPVPLVPAAPPALPLPEAPPLLLDQRHLRRTQAGATRTASASSTIASVSNTDDYDLQRQS